MVTTKNAISPGHAREDASYLAACALGMAFSAPTDISTCVARLMTVTNDVTAIDLAHAEVARLDLGDVALRRRAQELLTEVRSRLLALTGLPDPHRGAGSRPTPGGRGRGEVTTSVAGIHVARDQQEPTVAQDIVQLIQGDHDEVRALLQQLETAVPTARKELFERLVYELARHEAAEEAIVHPTLRDEVSNGEPIAESLLDEESKAEQLLADMESMDPESEEFLTAFAELRDDVLQHAQHEENEEHPLLRQELSAERLAQMGEGFEKVKQNAPTHPHPNTPTTPEVRAAAGPVVGVFDRMRDKVKELIGS
ncbi:MAG: hemerythrin domain-containing protein [Actinobacteria bacterium]|nr:hemerythrin domain-containing protein [Actinomycetota bacterium]